MKHALPPGWRLQHHASLPSTQDVAIAAAAANDPGKLAILADLQTSGRGSRGREWIAPAGNLNLSLLLRPGPGQPEQRPWALLAGLALHEGLSPYTDGLMLKWPNDVLVGGAKLGGILIDAAQADCWVVIGLGANLAAAPCLEGRVTTHLPPPAPTPAHVTADICAALETYLHWSTADLTEAWLACAHKLGTPLDVQMPDRHVAGTFAGLTPTGALVLDGYPQAIHSAEVFISQSKQAVLF